MATNANRNRNSRGSTVSVKSTKTRALSPDAELKAAKRSKAEPLKSAEKARPNQKGVKTALSKPVINKAKK